MTDQKSIAKLTREIERLEAAKRRALAIADEHSKEALVLRLENAQLKVQLAFLRRRL